MTPQASLYLAKGRRLLSEAAIIHAVNLAGAAGRTAYLAGFHAAQAFIFENTRHVARTHAGVHSEYARLTREHSTLDGALRRFLGRGYTVKVDADYGTDPHEAIDLQQAAAMIAQAGIFLSWNEDAVVRLGI